MIVEVLCTLIEDLICFLFGKELFNDKQQKNQFLIPVFIAIHTLIVTFLNRISLVSQYTVIISSLIMGIMFYLLFQTKFIYCIMYAITYYMFVIVVEMFMICLLSVILGNPDYIFHIIQLSNFNRIVFALSMKLLNIILYLIARRKIRNINCKILENPAYILFVIVGFVVSLKMMSIIINNSVVSLKLGISILFIVFIFMFGVLIFLTDNLYNEKLKTKENEYMAIKNEMLEKNLRNINKLYEENSKNFHEFKHHINIINSLLLDSTNSKAIEYLKGINLYSKYSQVFHTGNNIIDTVVNVKNTEASQKNIALFADVNIDKITVKDADLCSILSNLIDNAIEAVDKIENDKYPFTVSIDKNLKLSFPMGFLNGENIYLQLKEIFNRAENTSVYNPLENNFNSQKKGNHGWGTKIISDIVNKYNGNMTMNYDDKIFKIKIMLIQEKTI